MIIWIASYPKSGNTWIRSFLSTYLYSNKENQVFKNLKEIKSFPSLSQFKGIFEINSFTKEELEDKKKADKRKFEISEHWISAQKKINLNNKGITFLKTHNFGGQLEGNDFTNSENTLGVIYLIRDPRSVAVSNAYHNNISIDQSVKDLMDEKIIATNDGNLLEFRSSWRINYLSWKNRKYPKIIIRYEDLHLNPYDNFKKILIFINSFQKIEIEDSKIKKSINECSFDKLSKLEKSIGFDEQLKGRTFFRVLFFMPLMITPVGIAYQWRMLADMNRGPLSGIWQAFGLGDLAWGSLAWPARTIIMIADAWMWIPFIFIVLVAALDTVSKDLVEAADVDGAGKLLIFKDVIWPQIAPVAGTVVLIRWIEGFKLVDIPLVMTSGGPGISTETLTMHSWTQWRALDFGGSSAVAYTLLFVTVIICVSFFNFVIRKYSQANQL